MRIDPIEILISVWKSHKSVLNPSKLRLHNINGIDVGMK